MTDPYVYMVVTGDPTVGHLDRACREAVGEPLAPDPDAWPCARCVSLEQLAEWRRLTVPPEETLSSGGKTLESGPRVADTTGVGGCTPGSHQEDTTMNATQTTQTTPTAEDFANLKTAFAAAIAENAQGAAALRDAMLGAYRKGELTGAMIAAGLEMLAAMRGQNVAAVVNTPAPAPKPTTGTPTVATGHYAVASATGNNDLDFYLVKNVTEGKWAGRTFVEQVVGGHDNFPVRGAAGVAVLRRIVEAGTIEAGRLYGQEIGRCYVCHRTLTDEASRAAGIGPDCASREG